MFYFIDFEHTPRDSITKTLVDILLQLNHIKFPKEIINLLKIKNEYLKFYEINSIIGYQFLKSEN